MAQVNQRLWKIPGQRTKRKAWGFTAQINGKQVRRYKAEWTQDDAEAELAKALLQIEPEKPKGPEITLAQAADRYLDSKARKRTVEADPRRFQRRIAGVPMHEDTLQMRGAKTCVGCRKRGLPLDRTCQ
jgi:hypothetical protein